MFLVDIFLLIVDLDRGTLLTELKHFLEDGSKTIYKSTTVKFHFETIKKEDTEYYYFDVDTLLNLFLSLVSLLSDVSLRR